MGRTVKRREDEVWFAPDLDDNRDLPASERFQVKLRPLSGEDMMRVKRQHGGLTGGELNFVARAQDVRESIITNYVTAVKNYAIEGPDGDVFVPETGKDLIRAVKMAGGLEPDLVLDAILEALQDVSALERGLIKN